MKKLLFTLLALCAFGIGAAQEPAIVPQIDFNVVADGVFIVVEDATSYEVIVNNVNEGQIDYVAADFFSKIIVVNAVNETPGHIKGETVETYELSALQKQYVAPPVISTTMDDDYVMSQGENNILLVYEGQNIKVTNAFHPGNMPFQITSQFPGVGEVSAVEAVKTVEQNNTPAYNLAGQRTTAGYKGIIIKGGKKYYQR